MEHISQGSREPFVLFRISWRKLAGFVVLLPVIGLISCILLSLRYHFEGSTATHCRVRNYLPSTSAAIGGFTPQRYIWRLCICLHCIPRLMVAASYYSYYMSYQVKYRPRIFKCLASLASSLHVLENLALVLLTYVSSKENYKIHESSFILFLVFSQLYMILSFILYKWTHLSNPGTRKERQSQRLKRWSFAINVSSLLAACYFFVRHNQYCEPGVYTIFALCEYLVIFSNMAYHATAMVDFDQGYLLFSLSSPKQE